VCARTADNGDDRRSRGGSSSGSLFTLAGPFPAAACGGETSATRHLLRGVLFGVVPRKVVPPQPAARVDVGGIQHLSVARHVCARASSRVEDTRVGLCLAQV
jgi:hypothetical protein